MFECDSTYELEQQGVSFQYEPHQIKYTKPSTNHIYTPDLLLDNGIYIEYKGYFRPDNRDMAKIVRDCNPGLDIRFVFMNANAKINKRSKTTYATWCDKHNFKWAHKVIPKEWINE